MCGINDKIWQPKNYYGLQETTWVTFIWIRMSFRRYSDFFNFFFFDRLVIISEEKFWCLWAWSWLFLFLSLCIWTVQRIYVSKSILFNLINRIKYYYGYAYTINIFFEHLFIEKLSVAFTVIILWFIFQICFFKNRLGIKCFLYDVAHLIPNFIIFF